MKDDMPAILPILFSDPEFLAVNEEAIKVYVGWRVVGYHAHDAMMRTFGPNQGDTNVGLRVLHLESTAQYQSLFQKLLKSIPLDDILNERMAIHEFMSMYRNKYVKDSVRIVALDKACILAGITEVDDAGRTRRVPTLADLYAEKPAPLH